jgi:hypothetical protein
MDDVRLLPDNGAAVLTCPCTLGLYKGTTTESLGRPAMWAVLAPANLPNASHLYVAIGRKSCRTLTPHQCNMTSVAVHAAPPVSAVDCIYSPYLNVANFYMMYCPSDCRCCSCCDAPVHAVPVCESGQGLKTGICRRCHPLFAYSTGGSNAVCTMCPVDQRPLSAASAQVPVRCTQEPGRVFKYANQLTVV